MIGVCMRPLPPLLLAAALLAACGTQVVNPVTGQTERTVMDEQTEIAEGAKAHKEVLQEYRAYDSPSCRPTSTTSASVSRSNRTAPA